MAKKALSVSSLLLFVVATDLVSAQEEVRATEFPFSIIQSYPVLIHARVGLSDRPEEAMIEIDGKGKLTLEFEATEHPEIMTVRVLENQMTLRPFTVPLPDGTSREIDALEFLPHQFDLRDATGTLNRSTKTAIVSFSILVNPEEFPTLRQFGIVEPLSIRVHDRGMIDIDEGMLQLSPDRTTVEVPGLGGFFFFDSENSCRFGQARLCVTTTSAPPAHMNLFCPKEVMICPGESAYLHYEADNVARAQISPGIGAVAIPSDTVRVSPSTDTTYQLTLEDADRCSDSSTAKVRVAKPGSRWTIAAAPNIGTGTWTQKVGLVSEKAAVTSIRFVNCNIYWPTVAAPFVWHSDKYDPDGTGHSFDFTNVASTPWPAYETVAVAGSWSFYPKIGGVAPRGNACFEVTVKCTR